MNATDLSSQNNNKNTPKIHKRRNNNTNQQNLTITKGRLSNNEEAEPRGDGVIQICEIARQ